MASPPATDATPKSILLHVVSPNSEVPERLVFENVPVTETIADLKRRIQDAVATKPPPERQRLIYRGRALAVQDTTIQSILGSEALTANTPFTFHLVLSPLPQPAPAIPAHPDGLHQPMGLPALPINSMGNHGLSMPPRPASTSQLSEGGRAPQPPPGMPFNPLIGMIPPGLQPGMNIQMQFTQTAIPHHHGHGVPGMMPQVQQTGFPMMPGMPSMHDILHQQQLRMHQQMHQDVVNANHTPAGGQSGQSAPRQPVSREPSAGREGGDARLPRPMYAGIPPTTDQQTRSQSANRSFQPRSMQAALHQNHLQNMHIDQLGQFAQLQNALLNPLRHIRQPATASQQTVYLLSSPRGPEALLLSPGGTFATPGYGMVSHLPAVNPGPNVATTTTPAQTQPTPTPTIPANPANQPELGQAAQPAARPQPGQQLQQDQQPDDQVGDVLRILLPLGGHLWLLVRLAGFVWLFSGGRNWSNTLMLICVALLLFLHQTGIFNPLIRNVWQPLRQHVEGIINSGHPRPRPTGTPTPRQMADRLVEERQANENVLRRTLRRAERATILFAASLIPGVGESQIRARETAEREAREAEEVAERARVEAMEQARNQEVTSEKKDEPATEQAEAGSTSAPTEATAEPPREADAD